MLKQSNYNFIWPQEDSDIALIFNSFSAATMQIHKQHLDLLEEGREIDPESLAGDKRKVMLELAKSGFLLEDFIDEMKLLKHRNASGKYGKGMLALTIVPTFDCNLKCFYCFQERNTVDVMTPEIQEGILQFASKHINGVKQLKICWFGGEPLLAWDTVCSLSGRLMRLAEENGCEYAASMITNGYIFDAGKIERLRELKIKKVQITLDGPPSVHSMRKGLKGDAGENFDKILDVVRQLRRNAIRVSIRVNIDRTNVRYMDELLDILADSELGDIGIYPAQVAPYTQICSNIESACLNTDEFVEAEMSFYKSLLQKGLQSDLSRAYPSLRGNFCSADRDSSFSIGPDGSVYKCWNTIGNKNEIVSEVVKRERTECSTKEMKMRYIDWMSHNPFEHEECRECKVLPLCMGGCPYKLKEMNGSKPDCITVKKNLKQIILNHYLCLKIKSVFQ